MRAFEVMNTEPSSLDGKGINIKELLDGLGGSSGGSSGGGLGGLLQGFVSGGLAGGLLSLFGNVFQEGWSISCIGKQAYNNQDFEKDLQAAKAIVERLDGGNAISVQEVLDEMSWRAEMKRHLTFRSSCSKKLTEKFIDYCQGVIDKILPSIVYTTYKETSPHPEIGSYQWTRYKVSRVDSQVSAQDFENIVIPKVKELAQQTGQNAQTLINQAHQQLFNGAPYQPKTNVGGGSSVGSGGESLVSAFYLLPDAQQTLLQSYANANGYTVEEIANSFFEGSIRIVNGKVVWTASGGSQPQTPITTYVLIALGGLLAYKFVLKK